MSVLRREWPWLSSRAAIACALFVAMFITSSLCAAELTRRQQADLLDEAQHSYDRGIAVLRQNPLEAASAFRNAAERFELVAKSGVVNGRLFYNLANAYLQSGDLGRAILNYRRAERLIPGDARLESNLKHARSRCASQIAPSGRKALADALLSWHERTSLHTRFVLFLAAHAVFWFALLIRALRPGSVWLSIALVSSILWIGLGASVLADTRGWGRQPAGVLLTDETIVRKGNGVGFDPQFEQPLHAGVEFELLEHRGDWFNIQLANGSGGWIETSHAELVP